MYLAVNSEISITEIAFNYGYSESSAYNRAFKKHFGISPSQFRKKQERSRKKWKISQSKEKEKNMNKPTISIENLDNTKVIYVRFRGSYTEFRKHSRKMFNQLFEFAQKYNLVIENVTKVLTIYQDNPFITDEKNLRTSVAMTVPNTTEFEENEEISTMFLNGKYGVGHFEISAGEYEEAWKYMYDDWLFKEKVGPRDTFPFELYVNEPPKNFKDKSLTDIYIPIN